MDKTYWIYSKVLLSNEKRRRKCANENNKKKINEKGKQIQNLRLTEIKRNKNIF